MEAHQTTLFKLLDGSKQYVIPIYQRAYSWEAPHCRRLIQDLLRVAEEPESTHFIGSIVYVSESARAAGTNTYVLIDGQQRLTTLSLLILALIGRDNFATATGIQPEKVLNQYIRNSDEDVLKDVYLKLKPTKSDLIEYRAAVGAALKSTTTAGDTTRVSANLKYFGDYLDRSPSDLVRLWKALEQLDMVYIQLERGRDDPQAIFESLNSTGKDLTQTDLIRNFVLMDQPPKEQIRLHEEYWEPLEARFAAYPDAEFDEFSRAYVVTQEGKYPLKNDSYEAFKRVAKSTEDSVSLSRAETVLASFAENAEYFAWSNWSCELDGALEAAFQDIRSLRMNLVQPLFMRSFAAWRAGDVSVAELVQIVRLVESYLVRRIFTSQSNNAIDNTVAMNRPGVSGDSIL